MVMGLGERSNGEGEGWKQKSAISEQKASGRNKRKVKTRTLETHKDAAPKIVSTVRLSATRR
jgi:hypothetical protein